LLFGSHIIAEPASDSKIPQSDAGTFAWLTQETEAGSIGRLILQYGQIVEAIGILLEQRRHLRKT